MPTPLIPLQFLPCPTRTKTRPDDKHFGEKQITPFPSPAESPEMNKWTPWRGVTHPTVPKPEQEIETPVDNEEKTKAVNSRERSKPSQNDVKKRCMLNRIRNATAIKQKYIPPKFPKFPSIVPPVYSFLKTPVKFPRLLVLLCAFWVPLPSVSRFFELTKIKRK